MENEDSLVSAGDLFLGSELVDSLWALQVEKKKIDAKMDEIKKNIVNFAKANKANFIYGSKMNASVKEYVKILVPQENRVLLERLLREKGLYDEFSSVNYFKLNPRIKKCEIDSDIIELAKKESDFRISLKEKI